MGEAASRRDGKCVGYTERMEAFGFAVRAHAIACGFRAARLGFRASMDVADRSIVLFGPATRTSISVECVRAK